MPLIEQIKKFATKVATAAANTAKICDDLFFNGLGVKLAANHFIIKEYGEMLELKIDHNAKSIHAKILLKGETEPITVDVDEYELTGNESGSEIVIKSASADREWLDAALRNFIVGKSFKIPGKAKAFADGMLG